MMKAQLWTNYGAPEVLQLVEIPSPTPASDEILVKIKAANIFTGDTEIRQFKVHPSLWLPIRLFMGVFKPRIPVLGQEFSGTVTAVGSDVSNFKIGDEVFGSTGMRFGAYAELVTLPSSYPIIVKPGTVDHITASTLTVGGQHALHFLRLAQVKQDEHILIIGACGCIGTYTIQLAKHLGMTVTAIDSEDKLEVLRDCGADRVLDYRNSDYTKEPNRYDVIFDIVGCSHYSSCIKLLNPRGRYILANVGIGPSLRAKFTNLRGKVQVITRLARVTLEDLQQLTELVENGVLTAKIDRQYRLEDAVAAHTYIDAGKKKGHVVLIPEVEEST